jgi:hypothetical protein
MRRDEESSNIGFESHNQGPTKSFDYLAWHERVNEAPTMDKDMQAHGSQREDPNSPNIMASFLNVFPTFS